MHRSKTLLSCLVGITIGIGLVLSCSDDSPTRADAASCECPASEPPLAGRIVSVTSMATGAGSADVGPGASCPDGAVLLSGGCFVANFQGQDVTLRVSAPGTSGTGWNCDFRNNGTTPVEVGAVARCLKQAQ